MFEDMTCLLILGIQITADKHTSELKCFMIIRLNLHIVSVFFILISDKKGLIKGHELWRYGSRNERA